MEVEEKIRRDGHVVGKQKPPPPTSEDNEREDEIQNSLLQEVQPRGQLGRHLDQGRENQLPNPLFDVPANPKKADGYEPYKMNSKKKHNKKYHTPEAPGDKWLIDVKFVPTECKTPGLEGRFYQYTFLDEATRKGTSISRTSIPCTKASSAWRRQLSFSATPPKLFKRTTDPNSPIGGGTKRDGSASTRDWPCLLDSFCAKHSIMHTRIKPRTLEHNGKVERSHRIVQEKFYRTLLFHSLSDLAKQGARWMRRYNGMPRMALNMKSPNEVELEKLAKLMHDTSEVRCPKLLKRFTSSAN